MKTAAGAADARAILERRAERLSAPPAAENTSATRALAEFPVGGERYAIPLTSLRAALPLRLVRNVPLSPPHVVGIFRYEGHVLSVLSLAAILGVRGWRRDPSILMVIEVRPGQLAAVDSETIPRALVVSKDALDLAEERSPDAALVELPLDGQVVHVAMDVARLLEQREATVGR